MNLSITLASLLAVAAATPHAAGEDVVGTNTITARDSATGGLVEVVSTVYAIPGKVARFEYEVTNISYQPRPGETNGFSGMTLSWGILPGPFADSGIAPPGWDVYVGLNMNFDMSADFQFPFGPGLGFGESAVFGFETTEASFGSQFSDEVFRPSTGNSHDAFGPAGLFFLVDQETGKGPLIPVPAPGTVAALLGVATLGACRRRRRESPHADQP